MNAIHSDCLTQINVILENVLPAAVRGASREAGTSLEQKSYTENKNKNNNENKSKKKNNNKKEHKNLNKISSYKIETISGEIAAGAYRTC